MSAFIRGDGGVTAEQGIEVERTLKLGHQGVPPEVACATSHSMARVNVSAPVRTCDLSAPSMSF